MIKFERNPLSKQALGLGRYRPEIFKEILDEYLFELNTPEVRKEIAYRIEEKMGLKAQDITSPEDMDLLNLSFKIFDSSNNELGIVKVDL